MTVLVVVSLLTFGGPVVLCEMTTGLPNNAGRALPVSFAHPSAIGAALSGS